jgi:hypothetical protein
VGAARAASPAPGPGEPAPRQLSATVNFTIEIAGSGSVTGVIGGQQVSCTATCTQRARSGASVQLTATPSAGYTFAEWRGCTSPLDAPTCRMSVGAHTVAGGVAVIFASRLGAGDAVCEVLPLLCQRCANDAYRAMHPAECGTIPRPPGAPPG